MGNENERDRKYMNRGPLERVCGGCGGLERVCGGRGGPLPTTT